MVKKAKFLYRDKSGELIYEYKGRTYGVNPMLYTSTAMQHRVEQSCIDEAVEQEARAAEIEASREYRYEDTAQAGFDLFWKYVNGEIDESDFEKEA